MFKIYDGRTHFWQWDSDCKLVFEDSSITQVHFCNRTDECSLVCDVYEENGQFLVDVPNILLQTDWDIHVYAYDSAHTKHEDSFKVRPRSKPADYVYTETEVATWEQLDKRITELESSGVSDEVIAKAVEDYLIENPIDMSGYATKDEIPDVSGFLTEVPSEYVTEEELNSKGYATTDDVATAVSGKVTTDELNEATANFVTEAQMNTAIEEALSSLVDGDEVSY